MQVFDLIENMLLSRPNARGVFLSTVLWDQHMHEQMSDEIENGADLCPRPKQTAQEAEK